ncbi:BCCT family transporter [Arhodomonas sp. AD133]|uniref:BCCT family transporter n=1 Tax=Arhodomonas sp. AD133 TaxID=3415009 RepID=UPI003EBCCE0F
MQQNLIIKGKDGSEFINLNPIVFFIGGGLILLFVVASFVFLDAMQGAFGAIQAWIANVTGWLYVLSMNIFLFFVIFLAFTRWGRIRLGGDDATPEFSIGAWFAMLFSAGMGIGLLFYGVAEPMYHLVAPPHGAEPGSAQAAQDAMRTTFLHWGLHPWAVYTLMGLALAFFAYNRGAPLSIRALFYPVLGEKIHGFWGNLIDILATVATLFGVATSLGLGVSQVNAGLNHLFELPQNPAVQTVLIAIITAMATVSVVLGVSGGIKRLSNFNIIVAGLLLLFVFIGGPTLFMLNGFVENVGNYLDDFFFLSFWNETYTGGDWQNGWTVFYWGWWIAWSPFVGMFIARVSRGRTIRQFIIAVLLVPTVVTFLWLSVFGDGALQIEVFGAGGIGKAVQENLPQSLYFFLEQFPFSTITSLLATLVVITFFVTSSDSGSLVIDIITAGGVEDPPVVQRIFWAVTEGVVAAALLWGGGLVALQTAAITTGLPFCLLLLFLCYSLVKGLQGYVAHEHLDLRPAAERSAPATDNPGDSDNPSSEGGPQQ